MMSIWNLEANIYNFKTEKKISKNYPNAHGGVGVTVYVQIHCAFVSVFNFIVLHYFV